MTLERRDILTGAAGLGLAAMAGSAGAQRRGGAKVPVIDVHTHNFTPRWVEMLRKHPDADTSLLPTKPDETISYRGAPIVRLAPDMTDLDMRIAAMDKAGVDIAIISLTAPNVFWSTREVAIQTAREVNDDFAAAEKKYPGRIKWMASLPWQYPDAAIEELARVRGMGAAGLCLITNMVGMLPDNEHFHPVWKAVEESGLPAFIHPTVPMVDIKKWGVESFGLANTIGFTSDTALVYARFILTGFMDKFEGLKLIACHGGGTLPYLIARMDKMWENTTSRRLVNKPPSAYFRKFWYDAIVYDQPTLEFLVKQVGEDRVLYGSDYPFSIQDMVGVKARVSALPPVQRDKILGTNAQQLFKI
ncbi:aminocarboxymuconate-semialdehyde decarboxylase [Sphingobium sp. B7D2B]|uniref:amidohydrolase family protein n=1 Tax=unclassified Sphingobium TaxID=2611147 RepID=UPI0022257605|nr:MULTISPECIES: amidohydrolase family protein [unclassified Sphingobium]MCW2366449.1 aminocarboxymuconate-semialdehyde decarboxylase [Sphingobium sp. B7D2B]MCW2369447.1 aminocarboxymuconate-semialdehyde decarboxylase [Sphingobium sp. B11D3D]MCW2394488.1 aminocarboxymuconate-semialdehyde decarboxylase [Sphingobium sp. B8D3B]MCW2418002.1 aminocarboxymuconate-semialdehyde decarboxylase [Sphingobium sp. B8D3C]